MNIIVAVDKNWAIGKDNDLLISIPEDMKHFKDKTLHNIVIMGQNTLDSLPNGKSLPKRTNIVLTEKKELGDDIIVCNSVSEVLDHIKRGILSHEFIAEDIFVIGGESVYRQLLPYCRYAYITRIEKEFDADRYFPENLEKSKDWEKVNSVKHYSESAKVDYYFEEYKRVHKDRV